MDHRISVEGCRQGILLAFRVLDVPLVASVHWCDGLRREVPCFGLQCPLCPLPTRDKGFVPAIAQAGRLRGLSREQKPFFKDLVRCVIELTAGALHSITRADGDQVRWQMQRHTKGGPIQLERCHSEAPYTLPPTFDVRPIVAKMWGVKNWPFDLGSDEDLDSPILPLNPLPSRAV